MSFDLIKQLIDKNFAEGLPEAQIIIHKDGKEVFRHIAGFSDAEKTKPAQYSDLFWLFSMTKVFTMTAAMRLVERGVLNLDEPIGTYLESFQKLTVKAGEGTEPLKSPLTLRRLMSMTGGYGYIANDYSGVKRVCENKKASTAEIVDAFSETPLNFQPGTHFSYSFCHDIVAGIVEAVSGKTYGEFLKDELFTPLGITDMGFKWSEEQIKKRAAKWKCERTGEKISFSVGSQLNWLELSENYESGGAGLFGNAEQYIKLADALANGGVAYNGYRVLSVDSIELMRTNQLSEQALKEFQSQPRFKGYGYGLGVRTVIDNAAANISPNCHEFGWDGAAGSYVLIDPENHISIVYAQHIMGHDEAPTKYHHAFRDLTYKALGL